MSLYLSGVNYESLVDGDGVRTTIFLSGCSHHCPHCHNQATWSPTHGTIIDNVLIDQIVDEVKKRPFLSGFTLSGGDPFYNAGETLIFLTHLLEPDKLGEYMASNNRTIWMYTGYTFAQLAHIPFGNELLQMADVLVDGPFVQQLANKTLLFRGSSNQNIIDVKKTIQSNQTILWEKQK